MKTSKEDREQMRVKVEYGWPNEPTLLVHRSLFRDLLDDLDEAEARIGRLEGDLICDVCGGKPPGSGLPCICGGSGKITVEALNLRKELFDQRREHDMAIAERDSIQRAHDRLYANLQRWKVAVKRYGELQYVLACLEERYPLEDYPEPPDRVGLLRLVINKVHTAFRAGDIDAVEAALKAIPEEVKP